MINETVHRIRQRVLGTVILTVKNDTIQYTGQLEGEGNPTTQHTEDGVSDDNNS